MERVTTLINKLQQQLKDQAEPQMMLPTVQMLQTELINKIRVDNRPPMDNVSVLMPVMLNLDLSEISDGGREVTPGNDIKVRQLEDDAPGEKIVETLNVDEKEIEKELNDIKMKAQKASSAASQGRAQFLFDPLEDVPTLAQQDPLKEKTPETKTDLSNFEYPESLNDRLKQSKIELSQSLTTSPIKDLKKAIGVNDRFLFINELFRGDEAMYERSIKTIQNFSIFAEAEFWIRRELKLKLGWHDTHPVVKEFDQLVKRRFA